MNVVSLRLVAHKMIHPLLVSAKKSIPIEAEMPITFCACAYYISNQSIACRCVPNSEFNKSIPVPRIRVSQLYFFPSFGVMNKVILSLIYIGPVSFIAIMR